MLKLLNGNGNPVLNIDDFYIDELWSGLDELAFDIPVTDPSYKAILEESVIEYEQPYLVKAIDGGGSTAKVKCQLDLDELKADMKVDYTNGNDTAAGTIEGVLPAGWIVVDHAFFTARRTIESDGATPLEIIQQCPDTYGVVIRYDVKHKQVHIWDPDSFEPVGAFASRDLNLKEVNYKGKSSDFATRLYGYGKDGLSVASINGGKPYVDDFSYSDKVISAYWKDERYTVAENLLADMKKKLKELAVPSVSYSCSVLDLAKTNPDLYGHQDFSLMQVIRLVDDIKGLSMNHQVVQYRRYPFYPEKNVVTLSTVAPKIQSTVKNLQLQIEKPSSPFRQIMQAAIDSATEWITGVDGGYVVLHQNAEGKPYELLVMDKEDISTAKSVWRWNKNGWGYSKTGYNGPYSMAATIDGGFVADFIVAGTMLCDRLKGGTLTAGGSSNGNGVIRVLNASGTEIGRWDKDGIKATKGTFSGSLNAASGTFSGDMVLSNVADSKYPIIIQGAGGVKCGIGPSAFLFAFNGHYVSLDKEDGVARFSGGTYSSINSDLSMTGKDSQMKIDSDGMIKSEYTYNTVGASDANVHVTSSGILTRTGSSSRRYKTDESVDLGAFDPEALLRLPVKVFKYKPGYLKEDDPQNGQFTIGFIVEDMEKTYPYAVQYENGLPEMWNSKVIIPAMLKLIQRQEERIKKLEALL